MNLGLQRQFILTTNKMLHEMVEIIIEGNSDCAAEKESNLLRFNILKIFVISGFFLYNKELHLLVDRSNDFNGTWKIIEKLWMVNSNLSKYFNNVFIFFNVGFYRGGFVI